MDSSLQHGDDQTFTDLALQEGTLGDATFYDCRFERCDFNGANLKRSRLVGCTFLYCDLSLADLTDTDLSDVRFEHTALAGVNFSLLSTSVGPLELTFDSCTLTYAVFKNLDLSGCSLTECLAREAVFDGVDLSRADLSGTEFDAAVFRACNLSGADLRGHAGIRLTSRKTRSQGLEYRFPRRWDCSRGSRSRLANPGS